MSTLCFLEKVLHPKKRYNVIVADRKVTLARLLNLEIVKSFLSLRK